MVVPSVSMNPSLSMIPSTSPSRSMLPSSSIAPTFSARCNLFSSLAVVGTVLSISNSDDGVVIVRLPFAFAWRGLSNFTHITVTSNGVVFVGNSTNNGCCLAYPIGMIGFCLGDKRVAVAQSDLDPSSGGSIYTGIMNDAFVVSWEGVPHSGNGPELGLYFQVALYSRGGIELRWGDGNDTISDQFAAGLQDDQAGIMVPVTGDPFVDDSGQTRGRMAKGSVSRICSRCRW